MKRTFLSAVLAVSSYLLFAQCTPQAPTGIPDLSPRTDSLACIDRGTYYEQVIYLENFNTFSFGTTTYTLGFLRIDSIVNMPCGISWEADTSTYGPAQTGCIKISGTTQDSVGQYRLGIYITVDVPGFPFSPISGEAEALVKLIETQADTTLPISFRYYLRVKESADPCPDIDTSSTAPNARMATPPPTAGFGASTTGLSATFTTTNYSSGAISYVWDFGDGNTSISPNPTNLYSSAGTYEVQLIVEGLCGSDTTSQMVTVTTVGIKDLSATDLFFDVYPNPSTGAFTFKLTKEGLADFNVRVTDLQGKEVFYAEYNTVGLSGVQKIDLGHLEKGAYLIQVTSDNLSQIKRIALY